MYFSGLQEGQALVGGGVVIGREAQPLRPARQNPRSVSAATRQRFVIKGRTAGPVAAR
jgi:hypothetical protein